MKTAQEIADEIEATLPLDGIEQYSMDFLSRSDINFALMKAVLEARKEDGFTKPLNREDWKRIEAALNDAVNTTLNYPAHRAYLRTLDKVQRHNQTGRYTPRNSH